MARYDDDTVASIIEDSKDIVEKVKKSDFMSNSPSAEDMAKIGWYNGIPFHIELLKLINVLKAEIPSIEFGAHRHTRGNVVHMPSGGMFRVICEAHAYIPDDVYALGTIGYDDFCVTRARNGAHRESTFMVKSRTIENEKYDEYREQYSMYMSKNMDKIVKLAKKHLRSYAPYEVVKIASRKVADNLTSAIYACSNDANSASRKLINDSVIGQLKHLVETGYNFLSPEAKEIITTAVNKETSYRNLKDKKVSGKYVVVSNQMGVQMFDVFNHDDATYSPSDDWEGENGVRYRMDEVPENIIGKVAVLSMTQVEDYVEGVGNRVGGTTFWVQDET